MVQLRLRARLHTGARARARVVLASGIALALAAGCNLIYGTGDYFVVENAGSDGGPSGGQDGEVDAPPPDCTTNAECTTRFTALGPLDAGPDANPEAGPLGVLEGGVAPAMCVKGHCARLLSEDCKSVLGDYQNDDAILLATLFSTVGSQAATNIARERSALLAAEEVNSSLGGGGVPPAQKGGPARPLVVVSCDEVTNLDRVANHLVNDLKVPAIVGPNLSQDTLDLTTKYSAKGGTLLMSPASVASAISSLSDNDLTWRSIPSDTQRAKLLINQINAVEAQIKPMRTPQLKLAIVYRDDALGQSTFSSISGSLLFNGKAISDPANVPYVKTYRYSPQSVMSQTDIASALQDSKPDVVTMFGTAESVTNILVPVEQALETAAVNFRPYYVLIDSNKVKELIDAFKLPNVPTGLRERVRGTGVKPPTESEPVFTAFNAAYESRYGQNPRVSSMGPSYDAMYALAYALAATTNDPVSGASIAKGLKRLGAGPDVPVGRTTILDAFQKLTVGEAVSPVGTFGRLKWDEKGDILGGQVEIWCIASGATPSYATSGLTMDVLSQEISGTYTQCP